MKESKNMDSDVVGPRLEVWPNVDFIVEPEVVIPLHGTEGDEFLVDIEFVLCVSRDANLHRQRHVAMVKRELPPEMHKQTSSVRCVLGEGWVPYPRPVERSRHFGDT